MKQVGQKSDYKLAKNETQNACSQNQKTSRDNDSFTNDNTPKSNRINIINLVMNKHSLNQNEENTDGHLQQPNDKTSLERMLKTSPFAQGKFNDLNKSMMEFYNTKMQMCDASPAPAFGLLKKDSSVGDGYLDMAKSPNFQQKQDTSIPLCENHYKASEYNHFVPDDESDMDQDKALNHIIPHFKFSKPQNPFEADLQEAEQDFNTPKLGEDPESDLDDPIQDFFSPKKLNEKILEPEQEFTSNKIILKIQKPTSGIQKSRGKPILCGKKRKANQGSTSSKDQKTAGIGVDQTKNKLSTKIEPLIKRKIKQIEKGARNRKFRPDVTVSVNQDNTAMRKSQRLRKKESSMEECKGCTCKKSQCIKLYCECFIAQGFCSPSCSCQD
jgi:hypothetical protein